MNRYIGYEYKEVSAPRAHLSMYIDGYASFGWLPDENAAQHGTILKLKRDRKMINKMELTRLERNFEACMAEIEALERAKTSTATMHAILIGLVGTAFLAGSVFAVTHSPPLIWLTIVLGLPGLIGWALPILLYRTFVRRSVKKLTPLIEAKYDEIYTVCDKGNQLLND